MKKSILINYEEYESVEALSIADRELMASAVAAADGAYSPYSHFCVGAAVRLVDGSIVIGSNQENVAYPSGLCAERTAMFAASAQHPGVAFEALAIVGRPEGGELTAASPCGACRQVMAEYEKRWGRPLRVLLYWAGGHVVVFEGVDSLLPFGFAF